MLQEVLLGAVAAAVLTTLAAALLIRRAAHPGLLMAVFVLAGGSTGAVLSGDPAGWLVTGFVVLLVPVTVSGLRWHGAWSPWARVAYSALVQASAVYLVAVAVVVVAASPGLAGYALGTLVFLLQLVSLVVMLSFAFEIYDVLGRRRFPARDAAAAVPEPSRWPGVCFQIPAYNEPPELLAETIEQVMRQDYPGRWMVQVIDNNTPDEATWRPVQALCARLGERVQFVHLADWPGYKAGALNEGSRRLPAWVEAVAIIDADYLVDPGFLRATARHLASPRVAFVQTPQHYREWSDDGYLAGLFHQFKYFFDLAMPSRHERNAIIFGGTMGLVRRQALEGIGGWDERCLTEDAEASLRFLGAGWRGVYDPTSYGAGLMPLSFEGLKKQRFRWAFGGMQVLRKHGIGLLFGKGEATRQMSTAQRLAYLMGGLQWCNELLTVLFTALLLLTAGATLARGRLGLPAVTGAALAFPPLLILSGVARTQWALRRTSGCSRRQAVRAQLVFFALSWVVARACLAGLVRGSGTFLRTPKARAARAWQRGLRASSQEMALAVACVAGAALLAALRPGLVTEVLAALLAVQGSIYGSAPLCAVWAEGIRLTPTRATFARSPQNTGQRPRRRIAMRTGLGLGLALAGALAAALVITAPPGAGPFPGISTGPSLGGLLSRPHAAGPSAQRRPTSVPATPSIIAAAAPIGAASRPSQSPALSGAAPSASPPSSPSSAASTPTPTATPLPTSKAHPTSSPSATPTPRGSPSPRPSATP
jgi:hypothetical protein